MGRGPAPAMPVKKDSSVSIRIRDERTGSEFHPEEWEGIAVRAQAEVARIHIANGEARILEAAREKVRKAIPFADPATIDQRAMRIVEASVRTVKTRSDVEAVRSGRKKTCHTCKFRCGFGTDCGHPLNMIEEERYDGEITTKPGGSRDSRSGSGACGPEAILWERRRPLQYVKGTDRVSDFWNFAFGILIAVLFFTVIAFAVSISGQGRHHAKPVATIPT